MSTHSDALYVWLIFGVVVLASVATFVYRRRHPSPAERWERAKDAAHGFEREAARQRSSAEIHEELIRTKDNKTRSAARRAGR